MLQNEDQNKHWPALSNLMVATQMTTRRKQKY